MLNSPEGLEDAMGTWLMAEARVGRRWLVGGRFDWAENPDEPEESSWLAGPSITWWQSEWVRIRAEYDLLQGPTGRRGLFLIQTTFALGPHRHENY